MHSESFKTGLTYPFTTHHLIYQLVTNKYRNRNNDILHMPNSLLMEVNFSSDKGLVKISANCLLVSIKCNSILFFITSSLRKWCLISICFVLECWIEFWDKFLLICHIKWVCIQDQYNSHLIDFLSTTLVLHNYLQQHILLLQLRV